MRRCDRANRPKNRLLAHVDQTEQLAAGSLPGHGAAAISTEVLIDERRRPSRDPLEEFIVLAASGSTELSTFTMNACGAAEKLLEASDGQRCC